MRQFGRFLMVLGVGVGGLVGIAIGAHIGFPDAPWLLNVALAKLGFVAAVGLMAGGAASIRIANRRDEQLLVSNFRPS